MRNYTFLIVFGLIGCNAASEPCTVVETAEGARIECPDGSSANLDTEENSCALDSGNVECSDGTTSVLVGAENAEAEVVNLAVSLREKNGNAVLNVYCLSGNQLSRGTGTKMTDGSLLTAAHVLKNCTSYQYYLGNKLVGSQGTLNLNSENKDIAIMTNIVWNSEGEKIKGIDFVSNKPYLGQSMVVMHYPLDIVADLQVSLGHVVDDNVNASLGSKLTQWYDAFTTDYAAAEGSSGAPVFNADQQWIGIHVAGYSSGGLELNYVLPF